MKLAEAMKEKSRMKKKITDLRERLERAAQAETDPEESPKNLLLDLEETLRHIERLAAAIYHTNDLVKAGGKTMTRLIYTRDTLFFRQELYKNLIRLAENSENPAPADLSIPELKNKAERVKEEIRSLNDLIQKTNWVTDLIE